MFSPLYFPLVAALAARHDTLVERLAEGRIADALAAAARLLESDSGHANADMLRLGADLRLATALGDLAGLHASRGNTLQADAIRSRAIVLRLRAQKEAPQPQALGFAPPPPPSSVLASEPNLGLLDLDLPICNFLAVFSVNSSSF